MREKFAACCLAAALWMVADAVLAAECSCVSRGGNVSRSSQSGPGICSTAQFGSSCAIQALQAPAGESMRVSARLEEAIARSGLEIDVPAALQLGAAVQPEAWPIERFAAAATTLFALSQTGSGATEIASIYRELDGERQALFAAFTQADRTVRELSLGSYKASVSYGCIELERGTFLAKIRTPFSQATNRCGDFG